HRPPLPRRVQAFNVPREPRPLGANPFLDLHQLTLEPEQLLLVDVARHPARLLILAVLLCYRDVTGPANLAIFARHRDPSCLWPEGLRLCPFGAGINILAKHELIVEELFFPKETLHLSLRGLHGIGGMNKIRLDAHGKVAPNCSQVGLTSKSDAAESPDRVHTVHALD